MDANVVLDKETTIKSRKMGKKKRNTGTTMGLRGLETTHKDRGLKGKGDTRKGKGGVTEKEASKPARHKDFRVAGRSV